MVMLVLGVLLMSGGCGGAQSGGSRAADAQSSPQQVVEAFYAAFMQDRGSGLGARFAVEGSRFGVQR